MAEILVEQGALDGAGVSARSKGGSSGGERGEFRRPLRISESDRRRRTVSASGSISELQLEAHPTWFKTLSDSESSGRMREEGWARCFWLSTSSWIARLRSRSFRLIHAHDPQSQSRFLREARVTGRLEHPGIVPVYGLGRHSRRPAVLCDAIHRGGNTQTGDRTVSWQPRGEPHEPGERDLAFRRLLRSFHRRVQRGRLRAQPRRGASRPEAREHHARAIWRDTGR